MAAAAKSTWRVKYNEHENQTEMRLARPSIQSKSLVEVLYFDVKNQCFQNVSKKEERKKVAILIESRKGQQVRRRPHSQSALCSIKIDGNRLQIIVRFDFEKCCIYVDGRNKEKDKLNNKGRFNVLQHLLPEAKLLSCVANEAELPSAGEIQFVLNGEAYLLENEGKINAYLNTPECFPPAMLQSCRQYKYWNCLIRSPATIKHQRLWHAVRKIEIVKQETTRTKGLLQGTTVFVEALESRQGKSFNYNINLRRSTERGAKKMKHRVTYDAYDIAVCYNKKIDAQKKDAHLYFCVFKGLPYVVMMDDDQVDLLLENKKEEITFVAEAIETHEEGEEFIKRTYSQNPAYETYFLPLKNQVNPDARARFDLNDVTLAEEYEELPFAFLRDSQAKEKALATLFLERVLEENDYVSKVVTQPVVKLEELTNYCKHLFPKDLDLFVTHPEGLMLSSHSRSEDFYIKETLPLKVKPVFTGCTVVYTFVNQRNGLDNFRALIFPPGSTKCFMCTTANLFFFGEREKHSFDIKRLLLVLRNSTQVDNKVVIFTDCTVRGFLRNPAGIRGTKKTVMYAVTPKITKNFQGKDDYGRPKVQIKEQDETTWTYLWPPHKHAVENSEKSLYVNKYVLDAVKEHFIATETSDKSIRSQIKFERFNYLKSIKGVFYDYKPLIKDLSRAVPEEASFNAWDFMLDKEKTRHLWPQMIYFLMDLYKDKYYDVKESILFAASKADESLTQVLVNMLVFLCPSSSTALSFSRRNYYAQRIAFSARLKPTLKFCAILYNFALTCNRELQLNYIPLNDDEKSKLQNADDLNLNYVCTWLDTSNSVNLMSARKLPPFFLSLSDRELLYVTNRILENTNKLVYFMKKQRTLLEVRIHLYVEYERDLLKREDKKLSSGKSGRKRKEKLMKLAKDLGTFKVAANMLYLVLFLKYQTSIETIEGVQYSALTSMLEIEPKVEEAVDPTVGKAVSWETEPDDSNGEKTPPNNLESEVSAAASNIARALSNEAQDDNGGPADPDSAAKRRRFLKRKKQKKEMLLGKSPRPAKANRPQQLETPLVLPVQQGEVIKDNTFVQSSSPSIAPPDPLPKKRTRKPDKYEAARQRVARELKELAQENDD